MKSIGTNEKALVLFQMQSIGTKKKHWLHRGMLRNKPKSIGLIANKPNSKRKSNGCVVKSIGTNENS